MSEQEDHILLSRQANLKRVAIPLFLVTAGIYLLVAANQFFFVCQVDYTFIFFGAMYVIFAFIYICHSTSEGMQKILSLQKKSNNT